MEVIVLTAAIRVVMAGVCLLPAVTPAALASEDAPADSAQTLSTRAESATTRPEAILYYFHRTLRCHTCLTIEAYIDESLQTYFADALDDSRLLWRPTNIEESENAHFADDYSLQFNSAVLVTLDDEKTTSWSNLEKVWDLVENKKDFLDYIRTSVTVALLDPSQTEKPSSAADPGSPAP